MANVYQIHLDKNNFCDGFTAMQELENGWIEIDQQLMPQTAGQKFDMENMRWLDQYADWYVPPQKPEPVQTPQEKILSLLEHQQQSDLDRDELQIDAAIKMEEIKLSLENTNKFSGGGVTN